MKSNIEIPIELNRIDRFCLSVFVWSPCPPSFNFWVCPIWAAASQKINVPCGGKFKRGNQRWPLESLKLHNTRVFTPVPDKQNGYFYSIRKNQKKGTAIWTMIDACFFLHGPGTYIRKFALQIVWDNCWIMEGKHQKHNVVWTAPFWIIVDTFTASHGLKKCEQIPHRSF